MYLQVQILRYTRFVSRFYIKDSGATQFAGENLYIWQQVLLSPCKLLMTLKQSQQSAIENNEALKQPHNSLPLKGN